MNRLSGFLLCIILTLPFVVPALAEGTPKIFLPETEWDFGKTPKGGVISHKYWIKNQGKKVLYIIKVKPGCGCTKAPLEKLFVPPGDSTSVELIFNTTHYPGRAKKGANITSTDSITGRVRINFIAEVMPDFDSTYPLYFEPCSLSFKPELTKQEVKIKNIGQEKVKLKIVDSPDDFYETKLTKKKLSPGKSCKIEIKNKKELPLKGSFKSITLEAMSDTAYRFTLPIRWVGWDKEKE